VVKVKGLLVRSIRIGLVTAVMLGLVASAVSCKGNTQGTKAVPKQMTPEQFKQGMDMSKMQKGAGGSPTAPAAESGGQ